MTLPVNGGMAHMGADFSWMKTWSGEVMRVLGTLRGHIGAVDRRNLPMRAAAVGTGRRRAGCGTGICSIPVTQVYIQCFTNFTGPECSKRRTGQRQTVSPALGRSGHPVGSLADWRHPSRIKDLRSIAGGGGQGEAKAHAEAPEPRDEPEPKR